VASAIGSENPIVHVFAAIAADYAISRSGRYTTTHRALTDEERQALHELGNAASARITLAAHQWTIRAACHILLCLQVGPLWRVQLEDRRRLTEIGSAHADAGARAAADRCLVTEWPGMGQG